MAVNRTTGLDWLDALVLGKWRLAEWRWWDEDIVPGFKAAGVDVSRLEPVGSPIRGVSVRNKHGQWRNAKVEGDENDDLREIQAIARLLQALE